MNYKVDNNFFKSQTTRLSVNKRFTPSFTTGMATPPNIRALAQISSKIHCVITQPRNSGTLEKLGFLNIIFRLRPGFRLDHNPVVNDRETKEYSEAYDFSRGREKTNLTHGFNRGSMMSVYNNRFNGLQNFKNILTIK